MAMFKVATSWEVMFMVMFKVTICSRHAMMCPTIQLSQHFSHSTITKGMFGVQRVSIWGELYFTMQHCHPASLLVMFIM